MSKVFCVCVVMLRKCDEGRERSCGRLYRRKRVKKHRRSVNSSFFHTWMRCWSRSTTVPSCWRMYAVPCLVCPDGETHRGRQGKPLRPKPRTQTCWVRSTDPPPLGRSIHGKKDGQLTYPMKKDRQHQGPHESRIAPRFLSASTLPQPALSSCLFRCSTPTCSM